MLSLDEQFQEVLADVAAEIDAVPFDFLKFLVRLEDGGGHVVGQRGDAEHAAAVGDDVAAREQFGAGMEDDAVAYVIDARDFLTLLVMFGIASGYEHHAGCRAGVYVEVDLLEVAFVDVAEELHHVGPDAGKDAFGLGVAHADVVFDNVGVELAVLGVGDGHEADEDEALIGDVLLTESFHGGGDDALVNLLHELLVGKIHGADGTHAACVEACVVLADALVVLGCGEDMVVLAVGEDEDAELYAIEVLFDDHLGGGCAELAAEHVGEFFFGLFKVVYDEHALAGSEAVGLEHVGCLKGAEEGFALFERLGSEGTVGCCRDVVARHEGFGVVLAAFELGALFAGSDYDEVAVAWGVFEIVGDAFHEGGFGTHDEHIDVVLFHKGADSFKVGGVEIDIRAVGQRGCASVAGSDKEVGAAFACCNVAGHGVFAAARSEEKNIHLTCVILMLQRYEKKLIR